MIKVGLTGGIGTGKSHVAVFFKILGAQVFNSDLEAKKLMNTNSDIRTALIKQFGSKLYNNETLNKQLLSEIIFNNPDAKQYVNSIVHPKVSEEFKIWSDLHTDKKYLIQEAAILIESGQYKNLDRIIVVTADEDEKIKRVIQRDNRTSGMIKKIIANQITDKERMKYADFIIHNNTNDYLIPQILKIHEQLSN